MDLFNCYNTSLIAFFFLLFFGVTNQIALKKTWHPILLLLLISLKLEDNSSKVLKYLQVSLFV